MVFRIFWQQCTRHWWGHSGGVELHHHWLSSAAAGSRSLFIFFRKCKDYTVSTGELCRKTRSCEVLYILFTISSELCLIGDGTAQSFQAFSYFHNYRGQWDASVAIKACEPCFCGNRNIVRGLEAGCQMTCLQWCVADVSELWRQLISTVASRWMETPNLVHVLWQGLSRSQVWREVWGG